jgi:regulator of nucleoside diphosphate kinase
MFEHGSGLLPRDPAILLTSSDRERLMRVLDDPGAGSSAAGRFLRQEVQRADVVPDDVDGACLARLDSTVAFIVDDSWFVCRGRLVTPDQAHEPGAISVLTDLGAALLGLAPGQTITWSDDGRRRAVSVLSIEPPRACSVEASAGSPIRDRRQAESTAISERGTGDDSI